MSTNTYFISSTGPHSVYKTTDRNQRARLRRRGWQRVRQDELQSVLGTRKMKDLSAGPTGKYVFYRGEPTWMGDIV